MLASVIVKIFGAIFKIPLTNIIGVTSMAYFNTAYGFYVVFYMISTAGIPVALSKMISAADARGNKKEVAKIFKVSYWLFFILGVIGLLTMAIFAKTYSSYVKLDGLHMSIIAISPTLFFMCLISAYRGYFQGRKNMAPTAISQVIGAMGKLFLGLIVAIIAVKSGAKDYMVAAYTILGITIGSVAACAFLSIYKMVCDKKEETSEDSSQKVPTSKALLKNIVEIAIPITLSATILSLTNTIDTTLMVRRLSVSGVAVEEATKIMGAYTSMSIPLFNLSPNLIYPFAISVIPTITALFVSKKDDEAKSIISSTFRISSIIAIPCALGLSVFARPIISMLYKNSETIFVPLKNSEVTAVSVAAEMLSILAISIFFVSMVSVTNGILQAYGKEKLTIISTSIGIISKIILNYILIGIESINIYGAPISTLICYFIIMILNFYFLVSNCNYRPKPTQIVFKPLICAVLGVGLSALIYNLIYSHFDTKITTIIAISIAVIIYFIAIFLVKGIEKSDIEMLPKGKKIIRLLNCLKLLR